MKHDLAKLRGRGGNLSLKILFLMLSFRLIYIVGNINPEFPVHITNNGQPEEL